MDAQEEFGLKVYLTNDTVNRALANIELLDRAAKLLGPGNTELNDDVAQWQADYEKSK